MAACILVVMGAAAYSATAPEPANPALDRLVGEKRVAVEGIVREDPDRREASTLLTIDVEKINGNPGAGRVLVTADALTDAAYGDRVVASGAIELPAAFETDSGRVFDYRKYLLAKGVTHVFPFASVHVIHTGEGNMLVSGLLSLKHFFERGIEKALPEPESSLAEGLLLGNKQGLGDSITEAFRRAGVVHIIVLSGYNVTVIIDAVLFLALYLLPKRAALVLAAFATIAFALMTGASDTTVRASAMALIVLLAKGLHRKTDALSVLLLVAAGMALYDPYLVLYDLSYQLSVLATLGLILFSDAVKRHARFVTDAFGLREIVAATVSTQLTVLPLLIVSVGQVSAVSLFTNILVLPVIALAMLLCFMAGLLASVSYWLAFPATALAYGLLHYVILAATGFGNLPFSAFSVPPGEMWYALSITACGYVAAFFLFFRFRKR
jgi:competence protein ComEC